MLPTGDGESPRWLSEAIRSMCGGRNPPNKNLSRLYLSALPDLPINGALFCCPGSWCDHPHITTHMSAANTLQLSTATAAFESIDKPVLSIRTTDNPFHHLWNNNGTWWCHYTEHLPDFTKRRVRRSLHTSDSGIARVLRDSLLCEATHYED